MDITTIICTHNRALILSDTIESFFQLEWNPGTSYELLVVDNNSKDGTKIVVEEYISKYPDIVRYIKEEKVGLSHARNRGITEAKGNIIAFVDDDVYFDKRWGQKIVNAFKKNSELMSSGGRNIPIFLAGKPVWISEDLLGIYGDIKMGEEMKYIEYPYHPYGLNMAFRKKFFKIVGLFESKLGRNGKSLLFHEEADIFYRSGKLGLKTMYIPTAIIQHRISIERTTKKWILKYQYWLGISDVLFEQFISAKSRRELLISTYRDLHELKKEFMKEILCNFKKPLKIIYWHVRKIKIARWAYYCHLIGKIQKKLFLAFALKPLKP